MTGLPDPPSRLFGLARRLSRVTAEAVVTDLEHRWTLQHGRPLGDLEQDLALMREQLFNPVAREERLRQQLERLRETLSFVPPPETPATLARDIGGAWITTPEGRVSVPCLETALAATRDTEIQIDSYDIHAAEHVLATTYRAWTQYRIDKVMALLSGEARAMLPVSIATVLLLLVNGNVGAERALIQPKEPDERKLLDEVVTEPIGAFTQRVAAGQRADQRHWSLYNGYPLSEARRRLGDDLVLEPVPGRRGNKRVYVAHDAEDRVIATLARELRARDLDRPVVDNAFERFVDAYDRVRPRLAAFGSVHARTSRTNRIRTNLVSSL